MPVCRFLVSRCVGYIVGSTQIMRKPCGMLLVSESILLSCKLVHLEFKQTAVVNLKRPVLPEVKFSSFSQE